MILIDIFKWYFMGEHRKFEREQNKLAYMMFHTNHDIGMLPGGYYIHYSICYCKKLASTGGQSSE